MKRLLVLLLCWAILAMVGACIVKRCDDTRPNTFYRDRINVPARMNV